MCSEAPGRSLSITIIVLILELYGLLMPQQQQAKSSSASVYVRTLYRSVLNPPNTNQTN